MVKNNFICLCIDIVLLILSDKFDIMLPVHTLLCGYVIIMYYMLPIIIFLLKRFQSFVFI